MSPHLDVGMVTNFATGYTLDRGNRLSILESNPRACLLRGNTKEDVQFEVGALLVNALL